MEKHITKISYKIEELKNDNNIDSMIKRHSIIKNDLTKLEGKLTILKNSVGMSDIEIKPTYISESELENLYNECINTQTIEKCINKYNVLCLKIKQYEKYLNEKKIEIIKIE